MFAVMLFWNYNFFLCTPKLVGDLARLRTTPCKRLPSPLICTYYTPVSNLTTWAATINLATATTTARRTATSAATRNASAGNPRIANLAFPASTAASPAATRSQASAAPSSTALTGYAMHAGSIAPEGARS